METLNAEQILIYQIKAYIMLARSSRELSAKLNYVQRAKDTMLLLKLERSFGKAA